MTNMQNNQEKIRSSARKFQGKVVSTKMQETAVVEVVSEKTHSKYMKKYKMTRKFNCHNTDNQFKTGDVVVFEECRPYSKTKRWKIVNKIK